MNVIVYTLITTHIGILVTTIYLHRCLAHRQYTPHPALQHVFRFLLWVTDGVVAKPWVAQHRKHHKYTDVQGDPHSPVLRGFWNVTSKCLVPNFFVKYKYFDTDWALEHYSKGVPDDWIEKHLYSHTRLGLSLLLFLNIALFGWAGIISWLFHMFFVSLFINATITGFAHTFGYRNYSTTDNSKNLFPIGLLSCGEEMHNNHHKDPANPNFAHRWFEFDLGWCYITLLKYLGMARIKNR